MKRGYFEIGIYGVKTEYNVGTLWRSSFQLGAAGIFTIGKRYRRQASDTYKTYRHVPLRHYRTFEEFYDTIPYDCMLIGIEQGGGSLASFSHPERAIYLLGSEDNGLPDEISRKCHRIVSLDSVGHNSYNVGVAGSLVMYHRQCLSR